MSGDEHAPTLRPVEGYIRAIVKVLPLPVRRFDRRYVALEQVNMTATIVGIAFLLSALWAGYEGVIGQLNRSLPLNVRSLVLFVLGGGSAIYLLTVGLVLPVYRWDVGVRFGHIGVATIQSLQQESANRYQTEFILKGMWRLESTDDRVFQTSFKHYVFERQSWWMSLAPGDRILVLVHPTKPKVLAELGPVDAEPRVPLPAIPELAATRTNSEDTGASA
ncbi:MAG: hypothetical protein Fur005_48740 [Roseiflexaceae bacterium]